MRITYTSDNDSLSFWLIYHWQLTNISANNQWSAYRPSVGRYIGRDICQQSLDMSTITRVISRLIHRSIRRPTSLSRYIGQELVNMLTDISVDTQPICRLIHWSSVGRVLLDMSTDILVEGCTKYTWSKELNEFNMLTWFKIVWSITVTLRALWLHIHYYNPWNIFAHSWLV